MADLDDFFAAKDKRRAKKKAAEPAPKPINTRSNHHQPAPAPPVAPAWNGEGKRPDQPAPPRKVVDMSQETGSDNEENRTAGTFQWNDVKRDVASVDKHDFPGLGANEKPRPAPKLSNNRFAVHRNDEEEGVSDGDEAEASGATTTTETQDNTNSTTQTQQQLERAKVESNIDASAVQEVDKLLEWIEGEGSSNQTQGGAGKKKQKKKKTPK
eukprot:c10348_g1_i1.p1 GENE.c10348_g1_i1~~c10348_g1_i1.p1  ORF type:complete len:226 (-),score=69.17 c10348_g1_i1:268-903(-)